MASFLLSPPAVEPISLDEAKDHMRIDDTHDDALITSLIQVARSQTEHEISRALISQSWRYSQDCWPPERTLYLPLAPVQSISVISVYGLDGTPQALDPSLYQLDGLAFQPRLVLANDTLPTLDADVINGIEIDYIAGYGDLATDVPAPLCHALLMLVAHLYETREASISQSLMVPPHGYAELLAPFRQRRLGG